MYFASVILLLLVCPILSIWVEAIHSTHAPSLLFLGAKWLTFWAVGVRLFIAGIRQVVQPRFTAEEIFGVRDSASFAIVREVGFGNLSMGALGIWSVFHGSWIVPAGVVGGLYYGFAGLGHVPQRSKNGKEYTAMISDLFVAAVLCACLLHVR